VTAHASTSAPRLDVIDALRGASLFGVLAVNTLTQLRVSLFRQFLTDPEPRSPLDHAIAKALTLAVESKAFILFSFLFGLGLAAQHESARARGAGFAANAARRLGALLVVGIVHLVLVWNGDILTLYAVLGAALAALLRLSTRTLLAVAAAALAVHLAPLPWPAAFPSYEALAEHVDAAEHAYALGSYRTVLEFRTVELRPVALLLASSAPRTFAMMLLGVCAWRARLFSDAEPASRALRMLAPIAIVCGAATTYAAHDAFVLGRAREAAGNLGAILLAFGYAAAFRAAWDVPRCRRVLACTAPIGRMALTSYLTQSVVLGFVFYGYGLGLFGRSTITQASVVVVTLFALQVGASALWLRRYRFGPFEWLWRSFTYARWQPLRRSNGDARGR